MKAVLSMVHWKWISDPLNGPIELFFRDEDSDAVHTHCFPKGTRIDDDLIEEARKCAAVEMTAFLTRHSEQPIPDETRINEILSLNIKLRQALRKYGLHLSKCVFTNFGDPCNCGFDNVLRA